MRLRALAVVVVLMFTTAGSCAKAAVKYGDEAGRAARAATASDDIARAARSEVKAATVEANLARTTDTIPLSGSLDEAAKQQLRDATKSMVWQAFCDITSGELVASEESVVKWLARNAASFGLELTGDMDVKLAGTIVLQASGYGNDGPPSACEQLPNSGL